MIYFGIAVHSFKASLSHESKVLLIDSFENMIGNLLTVGVSVWCYDEVFKHHINGASTQTKAIALQWEYHKIPNCYLGNQVIITDSSLGTALFSFKEVRRNSVKSRQCHSLGTVQVRGQICNMQVNFKKKSGQNILKNWIKFLEYQKLNNSHNLPVLLRSL